MATSRVDLRTPVSASADDLAGLTVLLAQLIGERFRFSRVSYGDELTLHFGELKPARSAKLPKRWYGTYILGLRASPWLIKSGSGPIVIASMAGDFQVPPTIGTPLTRQEIEAGPLIEPDSRIVTVTPFAVNRAGEAGIGLQLTTSDGSTLFVLPGNHESDGVEDPTLPDIADWELFTPNGLLDAGPGARWSFKPTTAAANDAG